MKDRIANLLTSYLHQRSHVVEVQSRFSQATIVRKSVPQDSMLGSLLFVICINDLACISMKKSVVLYANDTSFQVSDRDKQNAISEA